MSSVTFPSQLTADQAAFVNNMLGHHAAFDGTTALIDGEVDMNKVGEVIEVLSQPAEVTLHAVGETITMRDGTKYRVTSRGWVKV